MTMLARLLLWLRRAPQRAPHEIAARKVLALGIKTATAVAHRRLG